MTTSSISLEPRQFNPAFLAYGLVFAIAFSAGARWLDPLVKLGEDAFFAIARAQYEMHLASQNVDASGRAEYAVLLKGRGAHEALNAWVGQRDTVSTRASSIPGWQVVSIPKEHAQESIELLREQTFARAVLRNRGLYICH